MEHKTYSGLISQLNNNQIFVFGSNTEGRHGKGTAKIAYNRYGAKYRQGHGLQGKSYGLITTNLKHNNGYRSVTKTDITENIRKLYEIANMMKDHEFLIAYTANGANLNGYSSIEMAEMFTNAGGGSIPTNIVFENNFYDLIVRKL